MTRRILFSSVGRRGQLIDCWRRTLQEMKLPHAILGVDCSPAAPGAYLVDRFFAVPRFDSPAFLRAMLEICAQNEVFLVIPILDAELAFYAAHREEFCAIGTTVAVSAPETVELCADKSATNGWLVRSGFPAVRQSTPDGVLGNPSAWEFPLILKPRRGSASVGVAQIASPEMLLSAAKGEQDWAVEEMAQGQEYTINVLVLQNGRCVSAVPHRRMEVRAGEVSKAITVKQESLTALAREIAEQLPGAYGALNIQCFMSPAGKISVTEINARLSGGYPLAYEAGADFPRWMLEELLGLPSTASFDDWKDGLAMLRYETAVFVPKEKLPEQAP